MLNPLAVKLRHFTTLNKTDLTRLDELCADVRAYPAKKDLIKEGDRPDSVFLLVEGWACRYKIMPDGRRQIMAFLVPGDLCDMHIFILKCMDHSVGMVSAGKAAAIPRNRMLQLLDERPQLARALWWSTLSDEAILREWIVNLGQRSAYKRTAHLLTELWLRLESVGMVSNCSLALPLTQTDIGDTIGLTPVHVNRVLQHLRADGLIELSHRQLRVPDLAKLMAASEFTPNYLHLDRDRSCDERTDTTP